MPVRIEARAGGQHPLNGNCPNTRSAEQEKRSTLQGVGCPFPCCEAGAELARAGMIHTTDTHGLAAGVCGSQQRRKHGVSV